MDLRIIWFIIIAVFLVGFFFLEGMDFGVGVLIMLLGKNNTERRIIINTIGPFWDGNEVWFVTAGAAMFAAFPVWYATMFSGFYLALIVIIAALILRGVYFEFRHRKEDKIWQRNWDYTMFISNILLPVLLGIAFANLIKGVPIDHSMNYVGNFYDLISPYTVFVGFSTLIIFMYHGAIYLTFKTTDDVLKRAEKLAKLLAPISSFVILALIVFTYFQTDLYNSRLAIVASVVSLLVEIGSWYLVVKGKSLMSFLANGLTIALVVVALFLGLFPRVMVSSINPVYSLTIYNASSEAHTLSLMTKIALVFIPIIIGYQFWTYWVFRKRVFANDLEY